MSAEGAGTSFEKTQRFFTKQVDYLLCSDEYNGNSKIFQKHVRKNARFFAALVPKYKAAGFASGEGSSRKLCKMATYYDQESTPLHVFPRVPPVSRKATEAMYAKSTVFKPVSH